jgi:hypothetical protein
MSDTFSNLRRQFPLANEGEKTMKLQFDVAGTDLASVRNYSYTYYLDGSDKGSPLQGVSVDQNGAYFTCTVQLPPEAIAELNVKDGKTTDVKTHTLEITVNDGTGESAKSEAFTIDTVKQLPEPVNLRLAGQVVAPPKIVAVPAPPSNVGTVPAQLNPVTATPFTPVKPAV